MKEERITVGDLLPLIDENTTVVIAEGGEEKARYDGRDSIPTGYNRYPVKKISGSDVITIEVDAEAVNALESFDDFKAVIKKELSSVYDEDNIDFRNAPYVWYAYHGDMVFSYDWRDKKGCIARDNGPLLGINLISDYKGAESFICGLQGHAECKFSCNTIE